MTTTSASEREKVAPDGGDDQVQRLVRRRGAGRQPRDHLGAVALGEIAEILLLQPVEQPPLVFGDDAVADARQHHANGRRWLRRAT